MPRNPDLESASLNSQVDRSLIPANEPCERYLLLTLRMPEAAQRRDRLPLNLSLIIDRSGSMSGDKLEYVKEAASHALRLLTEMDRVSVIIYDDEVDVLAPSRTLTPETRDELLRRIRQVRTGGMTNLSGGWFTGCDQIADYMNPDYLNRALLLTDGLANRGIVDQEKLVYQAKELRRRGITTTTFGVGDDFNQFLLQGIADGGGGHFYFIDKPNQIPNYFKGELGEMLATVAREITLEVGMPDGVEVEVLNDVPYDTGKGNFRLLLGDAYDGEVRTLAMKFKLPASATGNDLLFPLTLNYEDTQQRQGITLEGPTVRFNVASPAECEKQPVNEDVLREVGRLEAEQAKMEALKKEYQGDIAGAQAALRQAGATIAKTMSPNVAQGLVAELEEMESEMVLGLTATVRKAKHYHAYLKQRSRKDYKQG
jgi:Ca-activated chloride channel family protein